MAAVIVGPTTFLIGLDCYKFRYYFEFQSESFKDDKMHMMDAGKKTTDSLNLYLSIVKC